MKAISLSSIIALSLISTSTSTQAAPPPSEQQLVVEINKSIDDGVDFLRRTKHPERFWDDSWTTELTGFKGGVTSLAVLAMMNCGVKSTDKDVSSTLEYLKNIPPTRTYVVALSTMALAEARDPKYVPAIEANVKWLMSTSVRVGGKLKGWSYPGLGLDRADASNTQYALLALYAAKQAGVKIDDKQWKDIRELYLRSKVDETKQSAYWTYIEEHRAASFTMTVAGVSGLVIARMGLDESAQGLNAQTGVAANCGKYPENEAIRMGLNWIAGRFQFEKAENSFSTFYNIYGIERVGRLSGERFIGTHDWYREGCEYLMKLKAGDGSWAQKGMKSHEATDDSKVLATSFALLFLSKGRSPILISKLAHGDAEMKNKILFDKNIDTNGVVGWNRKNNDIRNITDYCSREVFKNLPLGWQVYDPRRREYTNEAEITAEAEVLLQSPILYINGHDAPRLTGQQKKIVKKYVEEGGFILAEACCGEVKFAEGFRDLIKEMFPNAEFRPVPPEHPVWQSQFAVPPTEFKKLEYVEVGCRTVMILSPEPLAGFWEESKYMPASGERTMSRGQNAFNLAANIVAYATGKEPPKQRLWKHKIFDVVKETSPPNGFVQPLQIKLENETAPAPGAMRNLMGYLRDNAKLDVVMQVESQSPGYIDLFKYKFLYMHGRKAFTWDNDAIENVKANLGNGGLLFADACCGSVQFDKSFRELMDKMYPGNALKLIPTDDLLYSEKLNGRGQEIRLVKRREKAAVVGSDASAGFRDLPPSLEGIQVDGRWVVIYSKTDIGCALENHKSTDCIGHNPESAKRLAAAAVLYSLKR